MTNKWTELTAKNMGKESVLKLETTQEFNRAALSFCKTAGPEVGCPQPWSQKYGQDQTPALSHSPCGTRDKGVGVTITVGYKEKEAPETLSGRPSALIHSATLVKAEHYWASVPSSLQPCLRLDARRGS